MRWALLTAMAAARALGLAATAGAATTNATYFNDASLPAAEPYVLHDDAPPTFRQGPFYYLTYSANNWESPNYGVGYAVATSPLGPWKKYAGNPILSQNAAVGMYSTGHGSVAFSPDGGEMYYVHHGRPTPSEPQRRLYTERMTIDQLTIDQAATDRPIHSGVAPYALPASPTAVTLHR